MEYPVNLRQIAQDLQGIERDVENDAYESSTSNLSIGEQWERIDHMLHLVGLYTAVPRVESISIR